MPPIDFEPVETATSNVDFQPLTESGSAGRIDFEPIDDKKPESITPASDAALSETPVKAAVSPAATFLPKSGTQTDTLEGREVFNDPAVQRPLKSIAKTAAGFVTGLPEFGKMVADPWSPQTLHSLLGQGAATAAQIKQVETSQPFSQEWWDAAVPLTAQIVGTATGVRESFVPLERPPIQDIPKPISESVAATEAPTVQTPVGVTETLAELKRRNIVTPGEVALPEPLAETISAAVSEPASPPAAEPTGISNKVFEEIYGDASPAVVAGKGPKEWKALGQARLDDFQQTGNPINDPYAVLTDLREGRVPVAKIPHDVSLLRAEHQHLVEDARASEGTPEYPQKAQSAFDMATAIKQVAHGPASDVFRALQEHDVPKYDNVTDFDQAIRERTGHESTPEEKTNFQKIANDVRKTGEAAGKEIEVAQKQVRQYRGKEKMSFDDAAKSIHDQIKELTTDCIL